MSRERTLKLSQLARAAVFFYCAFLLTSCSSFRNSCRPATAEPLVSLVHMTESGAPILSELIVATSGDLIFGKDLAPEKCRKASHQEVLELETLVEAARQTDYSTSSNFGHHYEQVQLRFDSRVVGFVAGEDYPANFAALIEYMDRLFENKFGDAYQVALEPFYSEHIDQQN